MAACGKNYTNGHNSHPLENIQLLLTRNFNVLCLPTTQARAPPLTAPANLLTQPAPHEGWHQPQLLTTCHPSSGLVASSGPYFRHSATPSSRGVRTSGHSTRGGDVATPQTFESNAHHSRRYSDRRARGGRVCVLLPHVKAPQYCLCLAWVLYCRGVRLTLTAASTSVDATAEGSATAPLTCPAPATELPLPTGCDIAHTDESP